MRSLSSAVFLFAFLFGAECFRWLFYLERCDAKPDPGLEEAEQEGAHPQAARNGIPRATSWTRTAMWLLHPPTQ